MYLVRVPKTAHLTELDMNRQHLHTLFACICLCSLATADVSTPNIFADHMVLQQGEPVTVWGSAAPGEKVLVTFADQRLSTTADETGEWRVELPAMPASSESRVLEVAGPENTLSFQDVLVGEVWLCSGQSNMAWRVNGADGAERAAEEAKDPRIRMFTGGQVSAPERQEDLPGSWVVASPETVGSFSATGYYFGRELLTKLDIPIGLINVSWGGSSVQAWTTMQTLRQLKSARRTLDEWAVYEEQARVSPALRVGPEVDDTSWEEVQLPGMFKDLGHDIDGIIWFRKSIAIPSDWRGSALIVELGGVDDEDHTYLQDAEIGHTNNWQALRKYRVAAEDAPTGEVTLTVRVRDGSGPGGFHGAAADMRIYPEGRESESLSLAGDWRLQVGSTINPPAHQHRPAHLYNGMIHPLRAYGLRGTIWYQGENNAIGENSVEYYELFPAFISDLRQQLARPSMPFILVQLPNFAENNSTFWQYPVVRDAQLRALQELDDVGMAITLDIGDPKDIHPRNKLDVGLRLARWALSQTYGQEGVTPMGPVFEQVELDDNNNYRILFDTFGGELAVRDGEELSGFEVAGADRAFHPAKARIEKGYVLVECGALQTPQALRYAWANSPDEANLINTDGIPASPFRTDDWGMQ